MDKKSLYALIRDEVIKAAHLEAQKGSLESLWKGHEPRVNHGGNSTRMPYPPSNNF
jgi:hypothetical protein